jgi:hypothetical protein
VISFSALSKYLMCPKMYDYHYNERLRPIGKSSSLLFGTLIDEALNKVLLGTAPLFTPPEIEPNTAFMCGDFDGELLTEFQVRTLDEEAKAMGYEGDDALGMVTRLTKRLIDGEELSEKQWQVATLGITFCWERKQHHIVEAYKSKVMPLIEKVHGVQVEAGSGFIDLVADVKGYGKVVLDNKTASRPYASDAVKTSVQLTNYADLIGCDKAGFIVIQKALKKNRVKVCSVCEHNGSGTRHKTCAKEVDGKRCGGHFNEWIQPEAVIDVIIDDVSERTKELTRAVFQDVEDGVKKEVFPMNLNQCRFVYGKPCPYINKCWFNNEEGLENK